MKKLIAILMAVILVLSMAACGSTSTDTPSSGSASSTPASSAAASTPASSAEESAPAEDASYIIGICQLVQHQALDAATEGFIDALTELLGDAVSFDTQNASGDSANCPLIIDGFVSSGYDLILANATSPLQAAASATSDIPVLGTSVTDYASALDIDNWSGATGMNISGTSDLAPLDGQAEMLNELFPDAKTVGILYCSGEANSVYQSNTITPYLEGYGYTVNVYTFSDSNDVAAVTGSAVDECDVIYIPTDNTAASCTEAINNVALAAGVPIVTGEEGICSGCGVATLSISYYDLGYATGQMAYEILVNGADIATMNVQYAPEFTKEYNAAICEELDISIPADYVAIAE